MARAKDGHSELSEGLRYTESGTGSPVVLLDWTPWESPVLAVSLADAYRVISVHPPAGATPPDDLARAVSDVARRAGVASYSLVGASVGANAAFLHALLFPESVSTLVVVSPTCVEPSAVRPLRTPEQAVSAMLAHPESGDHSPPDPERTAAVASLSELWESSEIDVSGRLTELACATLAVFGQEDPLVSRQAGGVWKSRVPNCSISYVYDAGHAIAMDRPEALIGVVMDFLERRETFIVENRPSVINP